MLSISLFSYSGQKFFSRKKQRRSFSFLTIRIILMTYIYNLYETVNFTVLQILR